MSAAIIIARMRANTARYCERFKNKGLAAPVGDDNGHVVIVLSPERQPMGLRGSAIAAEYAVENALFYRLIHRVIRAGRCGPRPAHKPLGKGLRAHRVGSSRLPR